MHPEAYAWVQSLNLEADRVLEIGAHDVNGSVRDCITHNEWFGVDLVDGPGVDWVGDICEFWPHDNARFDLIVCTEMLEHCPNVSDVFTVARSVLKPDGLMVVTCATDGRAPHSAVDGGPLRGGEYYGNVSASQVEGVPGFELLDLSVWPGRGDLYVVLRKVGTVA